MKNDDTCWVKEVYVSLNYASRKSILLLSVGFLVGICLSQLCNFTNSYKETTIAYKMLQDGANDPHNFDDEFESGPEHDIGHHNHSNENSTIAQKLYNEVKVLCWIMTNPKNHKKKARHVQKTWGKRCNKILFMSSETDKELESIALPIAEGRNNLWGKTKEAFKYIYNNHINEYDWFLKADDDTYVIVENLRYMLYSYDSDSPLYFGCKFKPYVKQGYMSGGAGYVLSKEAVKRFIEMALKVPKNCRISSGGAEDVEMGKCMENVGVIAVDTRDSNNRARFFPFVPEYHLIPGHITPNHWYRKYIYYKAEEGLDCCSDYAISFHYVSPNQMYVLDYLIYHLKAYGIEMKMEPLQPKIMEMEPLQPKTNNYYNKKYFKNLNTY